MRTAILQLLFCVFLFGFTTGYSGYFSDVEEVYRWKRVDYEFLPQPANSYIGPYKYFMPEHNDVMGLGYHPASGLILTVLSRTRPGVPANVAAFCISDYPPGSIPKFWAFPDFSTNSVRASDFYRRRDLRDGSRRIAVNYYDRYDKYPYQKPKPISDVRIVSTYAVNVDERCNRVFFMDTGVLNYYGNDTNIIQKPALLVYNLPPDGCETRNFQLIRRAEVPDKIANNNPFGFLYTTLDFQSDDCNDLFIYITNFFGNYLVVYDYRRDEFWSFTDHSSFQPITAESHFVYDETLHFQLEAGLWAVALGYSDENGDRPVYYVSAASTAQFAVSTSVLKNRRMSPRNYNPDDFKIMGYRGCDSQAGPMAVDYTYGVIFYAELQSNRVRCWNMNKPLNPDNIGVVYESNKLQYPVTLFIDSEGYLWFHADRLPILYFTDHLIDLTKINFRFFRVKVSDAIQGTVCE